MLTTLYSQYTFVDPLTDSPQKILPTQKYSSDPFLLCCRFGAGSTGSDKLKMCSLSGITGSGGGATGDFYPISAL